MKLKAPKFLTHNWREKILAIVLALLFWFMIKAQVNRSQIYHDYRLPPPSPEAPRI